MVNASSRRSLGKAFRRGWRDAFFYGAMSKSMMCINLKTNNYEIM